MRVRTAKAWFLTVCERWRREKDPKITPHFLAWAYPFPGEGQPEGGSLKEIILSCFGYDGFADSMRYPSEDAKNIFGE